MGMAGLIVLGVGLVEALVAALIFRRSRKFLAGSTAAVGMVVGLHRRSSGTSGTSYAPVVRFEPVGGQSTEFTSAIGSNPPRHREGEQVSVRYDPSKPGNARIDSWTSLWLAPAILGGSGMLFVVIGAVLIAIG